MGRSLLKGARELFGVYMYTFVKTDRIVHQKLLILLSVGYTLMKLTVVKYTRLLMGKFSKLMWTFTEDTLSK